MQDEDEHDEDDTKRLAEANTLFGRTIDEIDAITFWISVGIIAFFVLFCVALQIL